MRWVFRILGLLVVIVVALFVAVALIPGERIAQLAADQFAESTGREVAFLGDVRPSLWPEVGVATGAVAVAGSDGSEMFTAEGLSVGVDPLALLTGDIRIRGVEIDRPEIRLTVGPDGVGNWATEAAGAAETGPGEGGGSALPVFTLDRLTINDGRVVYTDADGAVTELEGISLSASLPDVAGPAEADLSLSALGLYLSGSLELATARSFLVGERTPLAATVRAEGMEARFDGNAALAGVLDGALSVEVSDPGSVPQLAALPPGLGAGRISVETGLAFADDSLALAGLVARLDDNTVTGEADFALTGPRPRVTANLDLGAFDLSTVDTPAEERTGSGGAAGWSTDPIDVSFLGLIDGRIAVTADSLALGTARLGSTMLTTVIEDRRSVTSIDRMSAYDGSVGGEVVLNGRDGFSTRLDVAGSALAISRLLSELVGYDQLIAAGDLRLNVLGSGPHMDAVMNSLNGEGAFNVGAGELIGLDIVGMLRNLDPSFVGGTRRTIFDEITVSFVVENGVIIYQDLSVLAPLFTATGTGRIGLGGQTLDMRLMPELLGGERAGLRVPLTIRGTWDAPRVGLDLENMIREGIESEVGQRLQREGAEQLGVTVEEGESVEDAVRGRIEDELREGLGNLLGR
ncbi:MAG: AsmA family protein [Paracoccaceae bacterium]|nr:AsmA family protein [Paracoccaceae bacterium]